jgi:dihydroneopterin aldolase
MKNLRKAYIKNFEITLQMDHIHFGDNFHHLATPTKRPEKVIFNFEIGYEYNPLINSDSIESVYEYTFIARHLKSLEHKIHSCVTEFLLQDICDMIIKDSRVYYVKADIHRVDVINNGIIGVGVELYK